MNFNEVTSYYEVQTMKFVLNDWNFRYGHRHSRRLNELVGLIPDRTMDAQSYRMLWNCGIVMTDTVPLALLANFKLTI